MNKLFFLSALVFSLHGFAIQASHSIREEEEYYTIQNSTNVSASDNFEPTHPSKGRKRKGASGISERFSKRQKVAFAFMNLPDEMKDSILEFLPKEDKGNVALASKELMLRVREVQMRNDKRGLLDKDWAKDFVSSGEDLLETPVPSMKKLPQKLEKYLFSAAMWKGMQGLLFMFTGDALFTGDAYSRNTLGIIQWLKTHHNKAAGYLIKVLENGYEYLMPGKKMLKNFLPSELVTNSTTKLEKELLETMRLITNNSHEDIHKKIDLVVLHPFSAAPTTPDQMGPLERFVSVKKSQYRVFYLLHNKEASLEDNLQYNEFVKNCKFIMRYTPHDLIMLPIFYSEINEVIKAVTNSQYWKSTDSKDWKFIASLWDLLILRWEANYPHNTDNPYRETAQAHYEAKNFFRAATLWRAIFKDKTQSKQAIIPDDYRKAAQAHYMAKQFSQAMKFWEQFFKKPHQNDPASMIEPKDYIDVSKTYYNVGNLSRAVEFLRKFLETYPIGVNAQDYQFIVKIFEKEKNHDATITALWYPFLKSCLRVELNDDSQFDTITHFKCLVGHLQKLFEGNSSWGYRLATLEHYLDKNFEEAGRVLETLFKVCAKQEKALDYRFAVGIYCKTKNPDRAGMFEKKLFEQYPNEIVGVYL